METTFKSKIFKISGRFAAVFVLLFAFRLIYGYVLPDMTVGNDYSENFFSSIDNLRKNYASEKVISKADVPLSVDFVANQKFEKTASVKIKTSEFDKDSKIIKARTTAFNAVIQYEQSLGQKNNRQLHLLIGVNPERFDSFYLEIQKLGVIKATEITKVDKTNEYRQLSAKKTSIEKTLHSLNELKSKGGQIADFVSLNDKILEIEEKAQELGVELGNFDTENEFCTVKISMYEGAAKKTINFFHRIKVALEWTIKYYTLLLAALLLLIITVFILLLVLNKLKTMNIIRNPGKQNS